MVIKSKLNKKFETRNNDNKPNGFLVPLYNIHEDFYPNENTPQQVYLTVISANQIKGPHLHFIRTGCFTCIKGNARFILKTNEGYKIFKSGEDNNYLTVMVPKGIPAALQNIGNSDAYVLNMPFPAWTPTMNDEHTADFSDFNFNDL
jgi:hypothetical protein